MDQYDLRYGSASTAIKDYIVSYYSRANGRKIGQALYKSHISSVITSYFDYVKYIEVLLIELRIICFIIKCIQEFCDTWDID